ncbi:MAG: hypothetical protein Q4P08_04255 [Eubacteriales bacterium]|nr:hypothetical protein [Eubacteriales bacterium]
MKSKILSVPNYKEIPLAEKFLSLKIDEAAVAAEIEAELHRIAKKHGEVVEAEPGHGIEEGDIVMLKASSELPKFNKPMIPVTVGRGLFDYDFEEAILGLEEGQEEEIELQGKKIQVKILKVKTKTIPELTLEMLQAENNDYFEPATSVEDYKEKYRQGIIAGLKADLYFSGAAGELRDKIIDAAEFSIDEAELNEFIEYQMSGITEEAQRCGQSAGDYMRSLFSNPGSASDEEIAQRVRDNLVLDFKFDLYARALLQDEVDCSKEQYEKEVKYYAAESGESEESIRAQLPYEIYQRQSYSSALQGRLMKEFSQRVSAHEG